MPTNHFMDSVLPVLAHQYPWAIPIVAILIPLAAALRAGAGLIRALSYRNSFAEKNMQAALETAVKDLKIAEEQVTTYRKRVEALEKNVKALDRPPMSSL